MPTKDSEKDRDLIKVEFYMKLGKRLNRKAVIGMQQNGNYLEKQFGALSIISDAIYGDLI